MNFYSDFGLSQIARGGYMSPSHITIHEKSVGALVGPSVRPRSSDDRLTLGDFPFFRGAHFREMRFQ